MSWLGETFGEGFSSIKGQLSKLTNEVLSEDPLGTSSFEGKIVELERNCKFLQNEIDRLNRENQKLKDARCFDGSDEQIRSICELEDQLLEVSSERDALKQSIEDIDSVHQAELDVVINDRNNLRQQLNKQSDLDKSCTNGELTDTSQKLSYETFETLIQQKDEEISMLLEEVKTLKQQNMSSNRKGKITVQNLNAVEEKNIIVDNLFGENDVFRGVLDKEDGLQQHHLSENQFDHVKRELWMRKDSSGDTRTNSLILALCDIFSINSDEENIEEKLETAVGSLKNNFDEKIKELSSANQTIDEHSKIIETLQSTVKSLQDKLVAKEELILTINKEFSELKSNLEVIKTKNDELNAELKSNMVKSDNFLTEQREEITKLKSENSALVSELQIVKEELQSNKSSFFDLENMHKKVLETNKNLERTIDNLKSTEAPATRYEVVETEVRRMINNLGVLVDNPQDIALSLKLSNDRLDEMLIEQRERSIAVNDFLRLEIRKLRGVVSRIRGEFLQTPQDRLLDIDWSDRVEIDGQNPVNIRVSQTDDVKCLEQDVAQMTEIIRMIDDGLTAIYQDKSRLEGELSNLHSVSSKMEKDLIMSSKIKEQLENDLRKMELEIKVKENELIKQIENMKNSNAELNLQYEQRVSLNQSEIKRFTDEIELLNSQLNETKTMLTSQKNIEKELQDTNQLLRNENNSLIESLKEKDKIINQLMKEKEKCTEMNQEIITVDNTEGELFEAAVRDSCKVKDNEEINELQEQLQRFLTENSDLKTLIQQLRETIFSMRSGADEKKKEGEESVHQHRRSFSQELGDGVVDVKGLRAEISKEQARYNSLLEDHNVLREKETNLKKEVERLRLHLVSVEDHYAAEAVSMEQELNETRSKLAAAEDQLRSSSTVYKSANVRSSQHLESLQNQIRLISVQRDDLQTKLSASEDLIQKHTAALASLQMVLEQFQLDKEREQQAVKSKYDYQIKLAERRVEEVNSEMIVLKDQLAEAKNGLKAALRLGEQLEKKSLTVVSLEKIIETREAELLEAKKRLESLSNMAAGKIDKSLIKNLVLGYLGASQGAHKSQALKILASVLDMSVDERAKVGAGDQTGWLSHLLHPRGEAVGESLSQAFVRFLESESRPQPQLNLLPKESVHEERIKKPPLLLTDLVLPTVSPTHLPEADSVLSDVLEKS